MGLTVPPPTGLSAGALQEEPGEGSDPGARPYCVTVEKTLPFSGLLAHQQNQDCSERPSFFCAPLFFAAGSVSLATRPGLVMPLSRDSGLLALFMRPQRRTVQAHYVPIVCLFLPNDQSRRRAGQPAMAIAAGGSSGKGRLGIEESGCWPSGEGRPGPVRKVQGTLDGPEQNQPARPRGQLLRKQPGPCFMPTA